MKINRVGMVGGLVLMVCALWLWHRGSASSPPAGPVSVAADRAPLPKEESVSWDEGPFTPLAGRDIRADLDAAVVVETQATMPPGAEGTLREKLTLFLQAFSSTDFDGYLRFRDPATFCAADDPRLAMFRDLAQAAGGGGGAVSLEPTEIIRRQWTLFYVDGFGPMKPGPPIEEVNWKTARLRVRQLAAKQIVLSEWDEHAGPESHLYKEAKAAGRGSGWSACMLAVPNRTSVANVVSRHGDVLFADFEVVVRNRHEAPSPVLVRFYWAGGAEGWLPLGFCKLRSSSAKPFFW